MAQSDGSVRLGRRLREGFVRLCPASRLAGRIARAIAAIVMLVSIACGPFAAAPAAAQSSILHNLLGGPAASAASTSSSSGSASGAGAVNGGQTSEVDSQSGGQSGTQSGGPVDQLIEKAREGGSTVVIINPPAAPAKAPAAADDMMSTMTMMGTNAMLLEARYNLERMILQSTNFVGQIRATLNEASPDGSFRWLGIAVATAIGGIALGLSIYKVITGYLRRVFADRRFITNATRAYKLRYLLTRATLILISNVVMFAIAIVVAVIFDTGHEPTRLTIFNIVAAYAVYRTLRYVIFFNFFAPDVDQFRMIHLDGRRARELYRDWYYAIGISVVIMGLAQWLHDLGISRDLHSLIFIAGSGLSALVIAGLTVRHRRDLVEIVRGEAHLRNRRRVRETIARAAVPIILFYLAAAWAVSSFRLTLGLPGGYILVAAPIIVFIGAIFVYGVAIYILDVIYERREMNFRRRRVLKKLQESRRARRMAAMAAARDSMVDGEQPATAMNPELHDDDPDDYNEYKMPRMQSGEEMIVFQPGRPEDDGPYVPVFKSFFEGGIGAFVLTVAIGELARLWGVDIGREGHPLARFLDSALLIALGWLFFRAINQYIDARIIAEGGTLSDEPQRPGESDSEGGAGQSRLATLLPIFRAVIIGVLAIIAFAIVLSNLGVDVGPLFAGAGVVGIAIGFGAQTLIRDIFSGLFFLIDDAFRKGEYIEVGSVRGVIEKISIRSFQLRHHLGAVHTVPFGEIQQLTNYSRDWVIMKLPLRVTYGTDVEKVRKLVKKLGQELLEDPEIGKMFLQPLKSQGVLAMEDSAMIIRVKFMTRPGDQFIVRKRVYAAIRDIFEREGIQFAHREVTVRLADGVKVDNLTPAEREAIAGSVRSVVDEEERARAAGGGADIALAANER